ncbi:sucrase-isomaltase, intestinal-like [Microcebus murinus]|uniref:sucrase-isomaltase, intestinal-like n=1 Tax=Microcebus murinus TaxID=30608 RepID=UPI003F6ADE15
MHEFTSDSTTHRIDRAFLWGPALMITPVLEEGARSVFVYFPEATWFDFYTGGEIPPSWQKKYVEVPAPLDVIPLFIRGGHILPTQFPGRTTMLSRLNPFGLIIALNEQGEAFGSLFWDDGNSIDSIRKKEYFYVQYKFRDRMLKTTVIKNGYYGISSLACGTIQILGLTSKPNVITMNGKTIQSSRIQHNSNRKVTLWISEPMSQELTISLN